MMSSKSEIQTALFELFSNYSPQTVCKMIVSAAKEACEFESDVDVASARKEFVRQLEVMIESDDLKVVDLLVQAMDYPLPKVEQEIQVQSCVEIDFRQEPAQMLPAPVYPTPFPTKKAEVDDRAETTVFRRDEVRQALRHSTIIPSPINPIRPIANVRKELGRRNVIPFDRKMTMPDEIIQVQDHEILFVSDDDPTDPCINISRIGGI
jgi:hypothetical protein